MKQFRIIRNGKAITKCHDCEIDLQAQSKITRLLNGYSKNWYLEYREVIVC